MAGTVTAKEIGSIIESRKPARRFDELAKTVGKTGVFEALDEYCGDFPDGTRIRRVAVALDVPEADLRDMAESKEHPVRRIGRLLLLENTAGITEDAALQKGLSDPSSRIRADAARFVGAGNDRTRLYNQLIKLIREDPDARVRIAAGKRLASSFADLYAVDFDGLPPVSRMLILDALEGITKTDEDRAAALLESGDPESSFRAARTLQRWGTLARLFESGAPVALPVLESAAGKGVVDYLESPAPSPARKELALKLAGKAGRDDIVRAVLASRPPDQPSEGSGIHDVAKIETEVFRLADPGITGIADSVEAMPLDDADFRKTVDAAFPPPERDRVSAVLFEMARIGRWKDWAPRMAAALAHEDPDVRASAAEALSELAPEEAAGALPDLLTDRVDRVRASAARGLASMAAEGGSEGLAEYLSASPPEKEKESVLRGIREAGGAALARCIIENAESLGADAMGELLAMGIDAVGVELLVDSFTTVGSLRKASAKAGPGAGESFLAAWEAVDGQAKKRLLAWIDASSWAASLPSRAKKDGRLARKKAKDLLAPLGPEERHALFDPVIEAADGGDKRLLRKIIRSR